MSAFSVQIETQTGAVLGTGPLVTVTRWQHVRRLSRAGTIGFDTPATDPRTDLIRPRRYVRCYGETGGARAELGLGIADRIDLDTERRQLTVGGDDLLRELAWRSVGFLELKTDPVTPMSLIEALDEILARCNAQADPDWSIDTTTYGSTGNMTSGNDTLLNVTNIDNWVGREGSVISGTGIPAGTTIVSVGADTLELSQDPTATASGVAITRGAVFHQFSGESVLAALGRVAEMTGMHWRLGEGREIVWLHNMRPSSGVRAVIGVTAVAAESNRDICLITGLRYVQDSSDVVSQVVAWGDARASMTNKTHPTPAGYTFDGVDNVLKRDAAETAYGYSVQHITFGDIGPALDSSDPDYADAEIAAADQLFDAALEYLRSHSEPGASFELDIQKLDREVLPGETIRVMYSGWVDGYHWVNIDADLLILEVTTERTDAGISVPKLKVATADRWPMNDRELNARMLRDVQQAQRSQDRATVEGLTITSGKTLTATNTITITGVDGSALTIPASGTTALLGVANTFIENQTIQKSASASMVIQSTANSAFMSVDGIAGQNRDLRLLTAGSLRWAIRAGTAAESGSNAGSQLNINAYSDTGTLIGAAFAVVRSTLAVTFGGDVTMTDAKNLVVGTTTGTKIGTATAQKLGFWNATPIVQPTTAGAAATFAANTSAIANDTATFDGYTIGQIVKALRNAGLLA